MKFLFKNYLFFLLFCVSVQSQELRDLAYGKHRQQTLDLFLPEKVTPQNPVVLMLHGGAWMMGGKQYTEKTARDLRDRGFVVANIDYRYVSETVTGQIMLEDIQSAMDFVKKVASQYNFAAGGYHVSGVSAGAHLALLFGYTKGNDIKSMAVLCAPSQLDTKESLDFTATRQLLKVVELLAGAKYDPLKAVDPKFSAISPFSNIKSIPTLLFHGTDDKLVPYVQSQNLYAELQRQNVPSELITMQGKGHDCGMNQPDSEKVVLDNMESWIRKYN